MIPATLTLVPGLRYLILNPGRSIRRNGPCPISLLKECGTGILPVIPLVLPSCRGMPPVRTGRKPVPHKRPKFLNRPLYTIPAVGQCVGHMPSYHQSLNLAGALVELGDLGVAKQPLDGVVVAVAVTAEHLDRMVGCP